MDMTVFTQFINHPLLLPVVLFFGTFILEDAAIVAGAVLVADGLISPVVAFAALLSGIVAGDLLLYAVAYLAGNRSFLMRWKQKPLAASMAAWLSEHLFITIFLVRFAPGLRLPCYLACGWLSVPVGLFTLATGVAGLLWVTAVFGGLVWLGSSVWQEHSGIWLLAIPVLGLLYLVQNGLKTRIVRYLERFNDNKQG